MKQCKPTKTWERTRLQNLVRHKSGRYYARAFAGGKEVWKSLKTSHYSVAHARLAEFLKEHRERASNRNGGVSAKMTFGEAAAIHLRNLDDNPRIKPSTRDYWRRRLLALVKSWRGLNETEVRKITQIACKEWASTYVKKASPTNYNNTIALLRHVLAIAIEAGVIYSNPAAALKRAAIRGKEIALPSIDKFNALLAEMRNGHSRYSPHCADFAAGLAFTGCRVGEAREIAWRDVDFDAGEIVVRGDAETGTKNWELRRVPLIPDARALFERMRSERPGESLDAKVFRVGECQKALDRACKKVGTDRITHHDLRHLVRHTVHRIRRGHSDGLALAWTQRRRCAGNENLRPFAARAQHCTSAARDVRTDVNKAGDVIAFPAHRIDDPMPIEKKTRGSSGPARAGGCPMPRTRINRDPLGCRKIF